MIKMVKGYRKKVSSKTGGVKPYKELEQKFIKADIKIGKDKFYFFLRLHHNHKLKTYVQEI